MLRNNDMVTHLNMYFVPPISILGPRSVYITRKVSSEIRIKDTNQREPLRRGRRPREAPVARVEHLLEPVGLAGAATDGDRAADEVPRHVMEKPVRREEHGNPVAAPDDVQRPHVATGILRRA